MNGEQGKEREMTDSEGLVGRARALESASRAQWIGWRSESRIGCTRAVGDRARDRGPGRRADSGLGAWATRVSFNAITVTVVAAAREARARTSAVSMASRHCASALRSGSSPGLPSGETEGDGEIQARAQPTWVAPDFHLCSPHRRGDAAAARRGANTVLALAVFAAQPRSPLTPSPNRASMSDAAPTCATTASASSAPTTSPFSTRAIDQPERVAAARTHRAGQRWCLPSVRRPSAQARACCVRA